MAKKAKAKQFKVTRQQIVDAAYSMIGWGFRHQGRGSNKQVDCVGFVVKIGEILEYPQIFDKTDYRRMPSSEITLEYLRKNLDEIPVEDVRAGDLYLIRLHGGRMCHVGVRVSDETNVGEGIHPQFIHAHSTGFRGSVRVDYVHKWQDHFEKGFRIRGVID